MKYTISEDKVFVEIDGYQIMGEYWNEDEPMYDFFFSSTTVEGTSDTEMIMYALLLREIESEKIDFKFSKTGEFPYGVTAKLSIPTKYFQNANSNQTATNQSVGQISTGNKFTEIFSRKNYGKILKRIKTGILAQCQSNGI